MFINLTNFTYVIYFFRYDLHCLLVVSAKQTLSVVGTSDFGILYSDIDKILSIDLEDKNYKIGKTKGGTIYSKKSEFKDVEGIWRVSLKVIHKEVAVGDLYIYKI